MPGYGKTYTRQRPPILRERNFDNEPLIVDERKSNPRKVSRSEDPQVNVNRTNKADFRSTVAHKNQRHDPAERIKGSDDMRAIYGSKRKRQSI